MRLKAIPLLFCLLAFAFANCNRTDPKEESEVSASDPAIENDQVPEEETQPTAQIPQPATTNAASEDATEEHPDAKNESLLVNKAISADRLKILHLLFAEYAIDIGEGLFPERFEDLLKLEPLILQPHYRRDPSTGATTSHSFSTSLSKYIDLKDYVIDQERGNPLEEQIKLTEEILRTLTTSPFGPYPGYEIMPGVHNGSFPASVLIRALHPAPDGTVAVSTVDGGAMNVDPKTLKDEYGHLSYSPHLSGK